MAPLQLQWSDFLELMAAHIAISVPGRPGVYRLSYYDAATDARVVFFVGQADNLRTALHEHLLDREPNACIKETLKKQRCYFRYAELAPKEARDAAERALYQYFRPRCNDPARVPEVPPADMNFE